MYASDDTMNVNPVSRTGMTTEHVAGAFVLAALALLWLIGRGFRGVSVGGLSVGAR